MQYTVTSRGQPIGVTDLGFPHVAGPDRIGWFHPNGAGEPLMATITSVPTTTRAWVSSSEQPGASPDETEHLRATLLADVAEASQRVEALGLKLHRENGSEVATDYISIQDVEELVAWADKRAALRDGESWRFGEGVPDPLYDPIEDIFDEELDAFDDGELQFELQPDDDDVIFGDGFADSIVPWTPDEYEPDPSMRYQIYVSLLDPTAIP